MLMLQLHNTSFDQCRYAAIAYVGTPENRAGATALVLSPKQVK